MRTRSIRKRLRIALGVIAMLVFTVVGGALYLTLAGEFERSEHAALRTKTEVLRDYVERNGQRLGLSGLQQEIDRVLMMDESGLGVWLLSPASEVLVGTGPLPQEKCGLPFCQTATTATGDQVFTGQTTTRQQPATTRVKRSRGS